MSNPMPEIDSTNNESRSRLKPISRSGLVIYILGIVYLVYLTIRSLLSPYSVFHAPEAWDMQNECAQSEAFPGCMYDIIDYDFTYVWAYHGLAFHNHDWVARLAWEQGQIGAALIAEARFIWYLHLFYLLSWTTLPFLAGWVLLFGYLLIYRHIVDFPYKWIEALVTGVGVAGLILLVEKLRVVPGPGYTLPPSFTSFSLVYLLIWFAPDFWYRRLDNLIAKAILLIGTLVAMALLPLGLIVKLVVVPILIVLLAFGYGRWRKIETQRKQIAVIVYVTLLIGVLAAVAKHWTFFTSQIFTGDYQREELAELINDFFLFFLGLLLTYLEIERDTIEPKTEKPDQKTILPTKLSESLPPQKRDLTVPTIFISVFIGAVAGVVSGRYLRLLLSTKHKNEIC